MKPIPKFVQMSAQRVSSSSQVIDLDYSLTSHYQIINTPVKVPLSKSNPWIVEFWDIKLRKV